MNLSERALDRCLTEEVLKDLQVFKHSSLPEIYYHATRENFIEFDDKKSGENTGHRHPFTAFYFGDLNTVELIRKQNPLDFGDLTISARLNVQNPLDITIPSLFIKENQASTIWEILMGDKVSNKKALQLLNEEIGLGEMGDVWEQLRTKEAHDIIVNNGYDGMIRDLGDGSKEYIVFSSQQIQILTKEAVINSYVIGRNTLLKGELDGLIKKHRAKRIRL